VVAVTRRRTCRIPVVRAASPAKTERRCKDETASRGISVRLHPPARLSLLFEARASAAQDNPLARPGGGRALLEESQVTARKKIGTGVTNPEKVTLELNGVVRNAVFKKIDETTDNWRNEVAATRSTAPRDRDGATNRRRSVGGAGCPHSG
jgi:hypothetical protein